MSNILIIGATSAIAEAVARQYAQTHHSLFLVGRNKDKLETISKDLSVRGASKADFYALDMNLIDQHETMLKQALEVLGSIDIVLIAHGTLPNQEDCQNSVEQSLHELNTNAISTIALLTILANQLEQQGHGKIGVISSVAGDRGRQSNYVYGSAKAAVSTFLSGLRNRLNDKGIQVLTIKPGFVDTPMTAEFDKGPLWAKPESVAADIISAFDKNRNTLYTPWFWQGIMMIICSIPEFIFKKLKL